jgi:hypothetical protein
METEQATARAAVGILVLDARIRRIRGDGGHPASFPFPVILETVPGATIRRLIAERDPALAGEFIAAGRRLVARGARALATTCGFMILFQRELARALPVPVFTSSLLLLPLIAAAIGPRRRIGVLTADGSRLSAAHLRRAGIDPRRATVCGLEDRPHFRRAILEENGTIAPARVREEVAARAREMVARDPAIGAVLLECANLPPYAAAVRAATGLPVFDFRTLILQVHAALAGADGA